MDPQFPEILHERFQYLVDLDASKSQAYIKRRQGSEVSTKASVHALIQPFFGRYGRMIQGVRPDQKTDTHLNSSANRYSINISFSGCSWSILRVKLMNAVGVCLSCTPPMALHSIALSMIDSARKAAQSQLCCRQ